MNALKYALPVLAILLTACKADEPTQPKVAYDPKDKTIEATVPEMDTTQIEISDLPVSLTGTDYILHPIGNYRVIETRQKNGYASSAQDRGSFTIANYRDFELTGFLTNIKVQKRNSDTLIALFKKPVFIQSATYLSELSDKTVPAMVFTLSDLDTNKDGKLDTNDVKTLYIGCLNAERLVKITPDYHELIDWNYMPALQRLYFRSIEDTNKTGAFDKDDLIHYYYIQLNTNSWEAKEYFPVS